VWCGRQRGPYNLTWRPDLLINSSIRFQTSLEGGALLAWGAKAYLVVLLSNTFPLFVKQHRN
jgi:hypothetical protein